MKTALSITLNITPTIEIIDLALYIKPTQTLVVSDIHMGYEEALNKKGILIPRRQFPDTMKRFEKICAEIEAKQYPLKQIIINGDLKHEFGRISETEWRHTLKLIDFFAKYTKNIKLVKGNHDTILEPIANKRPFVEFVDSVSLGDILILHGDIIKNELITSKVKTIIIGHEHCAISITQWPRTEKFKCYIKGKWKWKTLIAMPSFNLLREGTDILKEKTLSPFLKKNLKDFNVYVVSEKEVLDFGKLKGLK